MKKLSLEMLRLTSDEVLQRSQMKKITGGYGGIEWSLCTCTIGGSSYGVTCTSALANNGTNACCAAHYPGALQRCTPR